MNIRNSIIVIPVLLATACSADSVQQSSREINLECSFELQAARTAVRLRNQGKPKSSLLAQLAPLNQDSSRLLVKMYEITDEVYAFRQLNEVVYPTYRFEVCQRELLNKPVPNSIEQVLPGLMDCQQKFKDTSSQASTRCIHAAIVASSLNKQNKTVEKNGANNY